MTSLLEPHRSQRAHGAGAVPADGAQLASWVERLPQGNRNSGLYWAACRALEAGQEQLLDTLAVAAATTGLTDQEVQRTIASARQTIQRS